MRACRKFLGLQARLVSQRAEVAQEGSPLCVRPGRRSVAGIRHRLLPVALPADYHCGIVDHRYSEA